MCWESTSVLLVRSTLDAQSAALSRDSVVQPAQTAAVVRDHAADAAIDDGDDQVAVASVRADNYRRRVGVLDRVGQALAGDEVRRRLESDAQPFRACAHVNGQRRPPGQLAQRRIQAGVELRRWKSVRQLAQLVDRDRDLAHGTIDRLVGASRLS
jgi:hypothetical protein